MTPENNSTAWAPLLAIRPGNNVNALNSVVLSEPWSGSRYLVDSDKFFDAVAHTMTGIGAEPEPINQLRSMGLLGAPPIPEDKKRMISHWYGRGWEYSLSYYLWMRRCRYSDGTDKSGSRRREILSRYINDRAAPHRLRQEGERIELSEGSAIEESPSLSKLLTSRRTLRHFVPQPISRAIFASFLWKGLDKVRGSRRQQNEDKPLSLLISYGIAFDFYIVAYNVEGLEQGVYYYDCEAHSLTVLSGATTREKMREILQFQTASDTAGFTMLLVADTRQCQWRYRHERALRNLYIEAGRIGHELILAGMLFGLGSFPTPALSDKKVSEFLGLKMDQQIPIYSLTIGEAP